LREAGQKLSETCVSSWGVLPRTGTAVRISHGEMPCQAFEVYREAMSESRISFEHLVFLVGTLAALQRRSHNF
jgi:hypothetical protein